MITIKIEYNLLFSDTEIGKARNLCVKNATPFT